MTRSDAAAARTARARAWRSPAMRAILAAETVSAFGTQMTLVALPWFVLTTTGSATKMGLVFAIELLPVVLLGIPSALVVQRLGLRRTLLVSDLCRAPLVAAVPLLYLAGALTFPMLLLLVFVIGSFSAPYLSAQRLVIPETFGDDEAMVVQGNGLLEGVMRLAMLIGPALAGLLISVVGSVNILYIDAGTYLGAYLILSTGLPRPTTSRAPEDPVATGPGHGILGGARYALSDRLVRRVSAAALLFGLFFPPLLGSLPVLTEQHYGGDPRVAGFLFAAWGAGAVIGTFGVMRYATRVRPMRMGALAAVGVAAPLWILLLPLSSWQFGLVLLASGIFAPMVNAPIITLIMLRTPEELRAQVFTFVMAANLLAGPLGYGLIGPALDRIGLTGVLLAVAAGVSLAAVLLVTVAGVPEGA